MPDDESSAGTDHRLRVVLSKDYEIEYWTTKLDVNQHELEAAIQRVGNDPCEVAKYLGKPL